MANIKSVKTAAKVKIFRDNPSVVTSKTVPVNGHAGEINAEGSAKQLPGTVCAVMSLPPPTGQPSNRSERVLAARTAPQLQTSQGKPAKRGR